LSNIAFSFSPSSETFTCISWSMVTTLLIGFAALALMPLGINIAKDKTRTFTGVTISCYNEVEQ